MAPISRRPDEQRSQSFLYILLFNHLFNNDPVIGTANNNGMKKCVSRFRVFHILATEDRQYIS